MGSEVNMKILLVIDQFDSENNGTTISTRRFAHYLELHGHEVKVVTTGEPSDNKYIVKERKVPIATALAHKQGLLFAKPDKNILAEAIAWCDVVHFLMPFKLCKNGLKIAEAMGKPHTSAFHVQAENVTYNIGLSKNKYAIDFVYSLFKMRFYKNFKHIHCPSNFIAKELADHNYNANLHVISNGIDDKFVYTKSEKPNELKDKFVITMVGRLSKEKRQDVLINAVKNSKYADKIQLIFAGKGPKASYYKTMGDTLPNKPIFGFYSQDELISVLSYSDLYVHSADVEIEAISCIEALACGLVPVISNSPASATKQFALDERSLFECGNINDLKAKIEYWLDNPSERERMEYLYADYAKEFNIHNCVSKIENMFQMAINDEKIKERAYEYDDYNVTLEEDREFKTLIY